MQLDKNTWKAMTALFENRGDVPPWARGIVNSSLEKLKNDATITLRLENKIVTPSYLNFLREQISLNARGNDWSAILKKRLDALMPFENHERTTLTISAKEGTLYADFTSEFSKLIRVEVNEAIGSQQPGA